MKKLAKGIVALTLAGISLLSLSACNLGKIDDISDNTTESVVSGENEIIENKFLNITLFNKAEKT